MRRVADTSLDISQGGISMLRTFALALAFVALLGISVGAATADDKSTTTQKQTKNQMVKGTIKTVDLENSVLIVNQKVKNETVERQLDIKDVTEFSITIDKETKSASGKDGLAMLVGKTFEGASVQVKCDKDVNVLKVTVKLAK